MNIPTTSEELVNYINSIKRISDSSDSVIIKEERDKNYVFKYLYNLTKHEIIKILKNLEVKDFYKKVESTNINHKGELLYIWNPTRSFVNAIGKEIDIKLYIKTYISKNEEYLIVISFHEYNDFD